MRLHHLLGVVYYRLGRWRMEKPSTVSFTDLPVSQGARDLYERYCHAALFPDGDRLSPLDILAAADPRDVRSLLWARRVGKL